eukprot:544567-Pleurochrysis_carterae.AAC.1
MPDEFASQCIFGELASRLMPDVLFAGWFPSRHCLDLVHHCRFLHVAADNARLRHRAVPLGAAGRVRPNSHRNASYLRYQFAVMGCCVGKGLVSYTACSFLEPQGTTVIKLTACRRGSTA